MLISCGNKTFSDYHSLILCLARSHHVQNSKKNKWQDIILITCVDSLTHKLLWWPSTAGDSLVPDPDNATRNLSMASFSTTAFLLVLLKSRLLLQGSRIRKKEFLQPILKYMEEFSQTWIWIQILKQTEKNDITEIQISKIMGYLERKRWKGAHAKNQLC